ncbi:MAG TPA: signal peptidase I [Planctomycetes bacterium]|nr:signal peptidase I [Planctomycetota bacterium]
MNDAVEAGPHEEKRSASPRHRAPVFRETIEALVSAIIFALLVKQFVGEAYKVPTGSMEPTIHGSEVDGDRILVDKITGLLRDPRRFEVWVFRYPNDLRVNYIKRVIGIGPESLFIIDGDIWTGPPNTAGERPEKLFAENRLTIARKPDAVREAMLHRYPQIDPETLDRIDEETLRSSWHFETSPLPDHHPWTFDDEGVRGASKRPTFAIFRETVRDQRDKFEDLSPNNVWGEYVVGDVQVEVETKPTSRNGFILFEIIDPQHGGRLRARVPIGDEPGSGVLLRDEEQLGDLGDFHLSPDTWTHLAFSNVDDEILLEIDGDIVGRAPYRHMPRATSNRFNDQQKIAFGLENAVARFRRPQVYRDIYYRRGNCSGMRRFSWDIPEGAYFFLGDNSPSSKDSREWVRMEIETLGGEVYEGDAEAIPNPEDLSVRIDNPWREDQLGDDASSRWRFLDRFGNIHDLGLGARPWKRLNRTCSPFVPRDLILGRALVVFLPWDRMAFIR